MPTLLFWLLLGSWVPEPSVGRGWGGNGLKTPRESSCPGLHRSEALTRRLRPELRVPSHRTALPPLGRSALADGADLRVACGGLGCPAPQLAELTSELAGATVHLFSCFLSPVATQPLEPLSPRRPRKPPRPRLLVTHFISMFPSCCHVTQATQFLRCRVSGLRPAPPVAPLTWHLPMHCHP